MSWCTTMLLTLETKKIQSNMIFVFIKSFYVYSLGNKMVSTCNKWCSIMLESDLKYKKVIQFFSSLLNFFYWSKDTELNPKVKLIKIHKTYIVLRYESTIFSYGQLYAILHCGYLHLCYKNSCTNGMLISMYQKIFSLSTGFEMMNNQDIYTHDI